MPFSKKKRLEHLRERWGKPVDKYRNMDLVSAYFDLLDYKSDNVVDEKTWNDLEFDSIFAGFDRNISPAGQQYLYYLLHRYEEDKNKLKNRYGLISLMKENKDLREKTELELMNLSGETAYFIPYLVLNNSLPRTRFYPVFYLLSALSVISALSIAFNGTFLFVTLGIVMLNLIVNKIFSKKIYEYFTGFSGLNSLITTAISIGRIRDDNLPPEIKLLREKRGLLKSLKKKLGYLVIDKQSLNDLAVVIIEYLNMFLLFDLIAYYRSVNILEKYREEIKAVYETVASLDASISVASYLSGVKYYVNPVFHENDVIGINEVYHPLLEDAVPNTLENIRESVLITGSNMSGKTTFIKTVGVNFILAQTLNIALANKFMIPRLHVRSSIRRNEELETGKSYFFVEIELLNEFIAASRSENRYLFLIDEIFRGTNTLERLAASTGVLKYLDKHNTVFCTTHDIELQELLQKNYKMFHFSEQVKDGNFYFDYKINNGPCSSGNAIKLLGLMNYPEEVITESNRIVKQLAEDDVLVNGGNKNEKN